MKNKKKAKPISEQPFYGNKATGVFHSSEKGDECRKEEIKQENRVSFENLEAARASGLNPCRACCLEFVIK